MKQKLIYIVLLTAGMYLPASSRECGKVSECIVAKKLEPEKNKVAISNEQPTALPMSPFSRLIFNL